MRIPNYLANLFLGMDKYTIIGKYVRCKRTTEAFALQTRMSGTAESPLPA